jgi:hypothetical protein
MRYSVIGWFLFFGGLAIQIGVDYFLRMQDGNIKEGGFSEPLWFSIQFILGLISIFFLYKGTQSRPQLWQRIATVAWQVILAFVIYFVILLFYVLGTGIDSV